MAGITHKWNGTILTITSDSGTSSADLKGEKGDDGARGAQGAPGDCVATDTAMLGGVAAEQYALKTYVDSAVNNVEVDLSAYATKQYVEAAIPSLDAYATKTYVEAAIPSLDEYATKQYVAAAIPSLGEYATKEELAQYLLTIYPVGSIYISTKAASPASLFGGSWRQLANQFLLAASNENPAGTTGGTHEITLTGDQLPPHIHNIATGEELTTETGGQIYPQYTAKLDTYTAAEGRYYNITTGESGSGNPISILPPYLAVYMWERVA